jgi:hypothetical protein
MIDSCKMVDSKLVDSKMIDSKMIYSKTVEYLYQLLEALAEQFSSYLSPLSATESFEI